MPDITSTETHPIKSIANAHATIHIVTESSRTEFRDSLSETDIELTALYDEQREVTEQPEATRDLKKLRKIRKDITSCIERIEIAWVKRFLVSTDLTVDGEKITAVNIKQKAPKAFFDEVGALINRRAELGSAETKNSETPSTSSEVGATTTQNTIAESAV